MALMYWHGLASAGATHRSLDVLLVIAYIAAAIVAAAPLIGLYHFLSFAYGWISLASMVAAIAAFIAGAPQAAVGAIIAMVISAVLGVLQLTGRKRLGMLLPIEEQLSRRQGRAMAR